MDAGATRVTVVGIGADGWAGLGESGRDALRAATVVIGGARQLALLSEDSGVVATRVPYPKPLREGLPALLDAHRGEAVALLASGDPMTYGVGSTLAQILGIDNVHVVPAVSSVSLACARLGWPVDDVDLISVVGRPLAALHPLVQPGRRILIMSPDAQTPVKVAQLLSERGFGSSELTVLEELGGPSERVLCGRAGSWQHPPGQALNIVAVAAHADNADVILSRQPGLPDDAYENDGQLTKRDIRAMTLARLAPAPGELLWDVGAGAGSIAIEWMRTHPACRAIAIEASTERAQRVRRNADQLGTPDLRIVEGSAPGALTDLPVPDAVFIGGGASDAGVLEACWHALRPGGRIVVNAVTLETEALLIERYRSHGGELTKLALSRVAPIGEMLRWSPAAPVTQWVATKQEDQT